LGRRRGPKGGITESISDMTTPYGRDVTRGPKAWIRPGPFAARLGLRHLQAG
jgi:hypothetical protein